MVWYNRAAYNWNKYILFSYHIFILIALWWPIKGQNTLMYSENEGYLFFQEVVFKCVLWFKMNRVSFTAYISAGSV